MGSAAEGLLAGWWSGSKTTGRRLLAVGLALFMVALSTPLAAQDAPRAPTAAEAARIRDAAAFLESMGDTDWAANVREWLEEGRIRINPREGVTPQTTPAGILVIPQGFVNPPHLDPDDPVDRFRILASLASTLLHEKVHAHQAPGGNALAEGIEPGDWGASADVFRQSMGPEATEVEAYYRQIISLFRWLLRVLTDEELADLRDEVAWWLTDRAIHWAEVMKRNNFEQIGEGDGRQHLYDRLLEIYERDDIDEDEKARRAIQLLEELIAELFRPENGTYARVRAIYREKRTKEENNEQGMVLPRGEGGFLALTDPDQTVLVSVAIEVPPGVALWPQPDLDVPPDHLFIAVNRFGMPPLPDPGYRFASPVYEIRWNALEPLPFAVAIRPDGGTAPDNLRLVTAAVGRDHLPAYWTPVEDQSYDPDRHEIMAVMDMATMVALAEPNPTFADLPADHWVYDMVERLVHDGVILAASEFGPARPASRRMMARYLVRALGLPLTDGPSPFTDVPDNDADARHITTAYEAGLVLGVGDGRFDPEGVLTREQSMTLLVRARRREAEAWLERDPLVLLQRFSDGVSGTSEWARPYVAAAIGAQLVQGYPDGTLQGGRQLSHAEVAALVYRLVYQPGRP